MYKGVRQGFAGRCDRPKTNSTRLGPSGSSSFVSGTFSAAIMPGGGPKDIPIAPSTLAERFSLFRAFAILSSMCCFAHCGASSCARSSSSASSMSSRFIV